MTGLRLICWRLLLFLELISSLIALKDIDATDDLKLLHWVHVPKVRVDFLLETFVLSNFFTGSLVGQRSLDS